MTSRGADPTESTRRHRIPGEQQPLARRAPQRRRGPRWDRIALVAAAPIVLIGGSVMALTNGDDDGAEAAAEPPTTSTAPIETTAPTTTRPELTLDDCHLETHEIKQGATGDAVECAQKALWNADVYDGEITGDFDAATVAAVEAYQTANDLYVDGIVGGNTADSLGIWPGDDWFIVRTPEPAPGATDLLGFELSPVASAGGDAPPVPEHGGEDTGKRIVYSRTAQRVWAIDNDERVVRSYLVTGSQYNNELPGEHKIYSKSEVSTAWNGEAQLPYMVRWLDTERGAIGFHQIPVKASGEEYQTIDELGQKMSGGCQRQAPEDAIFMWNFGEIGTPVFVV